MKRKCMLLGGLLRKVKEAEKEHGALGRKMRDDASEFRMVNNGGTLSLHQPTSMLLLVD